MDFEIVPREEITNSELKDDYIRALIETNGSDNAIKVVLEPAVNFINWQSTLRNRLRKHGLRLRCQWNKGTRTAVTWTEPAE